eukprot:gene944-1026_t
MRAINTLFWVGLFIVIDFVGAWHFLAKPKLIFLTSAMLAQHWKGKGQAQPSTSLSNSKLGGKKMNRSFSLKYFSNGSMEKESGGFPTAVSISPAPAPAPAPSTTRYEMKLLSSPRTGYFASSSNEVAEGEEKAKRRELKSKLFSLSATCDRGFSAKPVDRQQIETLVDQLKALSPEKNPTRNLYPFTQSPLEKAPLEGAWRMIYTSAADIVKLAANPLAQVEAVHQLLYRDGSSVNAINLTPRLERMLPDRLVGQGTVFRLKVFSKAIARNESRIGLSFRKVELKPLSLLSRNVADVLPPLRASIPQTALFGADREELGLLYEKNTPAYFDVLYLDDDCLIIQQNNPGGLFIGIRTSEPLDSFL